MKDIALFGTSLADNRTLGSRVDKGLYGVTIDRRVDVEHGDVAKELRVVLEGVLIVSLDHLFPDLLFNHLLCFNVIGVSIPQTDLSFLLRLLLVHHFLETIGNNLLD